MNELTDAQKELYKNTAASLKGSARRLCMARVAKTLGARGQRRAARELGWDRSVLNKGMHALESGVPYIDNFGARGRKPTEARLPNLLEDIGAVVDGQSQTDPSFATTRLYTRLSAAAVWEALIAQKGYCDAELPSEEAIRVRLNRLGYRLRSVQKSLPQKK